MLATHADAERRYSELRKIALKVTQDSLQGQNITNINLSTITNEALVASRSWNKSKVRRVDWDWINGYNMFRFRYPKRFEMAIWNYKKLIGLSMGRPTYQGSALRLDVVEAAPSDLGDRPSIFDTILLGYGVYARMINAKQIRIMNPINEEVKKYYETFGYQYVKSGDFLFMEIY